MGGKTLAELNIFIAHPATNVGVMPAGVTACTAQLARCLCPHADSRVCRSSGSPHVALTLSPPRLGC